MSRRPDFEDDDGGFSSKYAGPEKRTEKSRKELLGVTGPRVPKAKARQQAAQAAQAAQEQEEAEANKFNNHRVTGDAYEYDPYADNPLRRAEQEELEQLAVKKSKAVTSDLRNALKITEDTKGIGAQTLVTLKEQGEQIARTHEKAVTLEQEMGKSERLLGKLGPMFSFGWKAKKGKKITGPSYLADGKVPSGDPSARGDLLNEEKNGANGGGKTRRSAHGNYLDTVEDEKDEQDAILDDVSKNLNQLKNMALEMGSEVGRQDKALDELAVDVDELNNRQKQANNRTNRILGRRR